MPISRHGYSPRANKDNTLRRRNRSIVLAAAGNCAICGQPRRPGDPFEADHIVAIRDGGNDQISNLRAAHRSCNRRRG